MKFICGVPVWEDNSYWVYYGPRRAAYPQKTAGKYLWFSEFRLYLEHIAIAEILGGFEAAKICRRPRNGEDFVLCLFAPDNSRLAEVEQRRAENYASSSTVFRGWKAERTAPLRRAACSGGSTSGLEQMLDQIDPEQHSGWC